MARSFNKPEQNKYTSSNKIKIDSNNSFKYYSEQNNLFLSLLDINIEFTKKILYSIQNNRNKAPSKSQHIIIKFKQNK
ncbi:hypothetical protein BBI01_14500 [Chryseobacterium artocarpi]|uniref:Uncharacterized protein n=1 Tax=Chryseobacterium artocarpi TaxID=1414727 RepID=A0A1B8ZCU5_9FLAO|nr:hypothetical protein BBI01_14500 [Chryseobacterium artocarpi]